MPTEAQLVTHFLAPLAAVGIKTVVGKPDSDDFQGAVKLWHSTLKSFSVPVLEQAAQKAIKNYKAGQLRPAHALDYCIEAEKELEPRPQLAKPKPKDNSEEWRAQFPDSDTADRVAARNRIGVAVIESYRGHNFKSGQELRKWIDDRLPAKPQREWTERDIAPLTKAIDLLPMHPGFKGPERLSPLSDTAQGLVKDALSRKGEDLLEREKSLENLETSNYMKGAADG